MAAVCQPWLLSCSIAQVNRNKSNCDATGPVQEPKKQSSRSCNLEAGPCWRSASASFQYQQQQFAGNAVVSESWQGSAEKGVSVSGHKPNHPSER